MPLEEHAVLPLAGGIGLSGGACGALGAAIWLNSMDHARDHGGKVEHNSPEVAELLDRFLASSNGEFDCAAIVGRRFAGTHDHAAYLRAGGCAAVIGALAGGAAEA